MAASAALPNAALAAIAAATATLFRMTFMSPPNFIVSFPRALCSRVPRAHYNQIKAGIAPAGRSRFSLLLQQRPLAATTCRGRLQFNRNSVMCRGSALSSPRSTRLTIAVRAAALRLSRCFA
jgi:hypothetical protein